MTCSIWLRTTINDTVGYRLMCHVFVLIKSPVIYYWTDARQHGMYLLKIHVWPHLSVKDKMLFKLETLRIARGRDVSGQLAFPLSRDFWRWYVALVQRSNHAWHQCRSKELVKFSSNDIFWFLFFLYYSFGVEKTNTFIRSRGSLAPNQKGQNLTRFQSKTAQKPYPLGRHIPIYLK